MAAAPQRYACQECGATYGKWAGRCDACGGWNTVVEEIPRERTPKGLGGAAGRRIELVELQGADRDAPRLTTGIDEPSRRVVGCRVAGLAPLVGGEQRTERPVDPKKAPLLAPMKDNTASSHDKVNS